MVKLAFAQACHANQVPLLQQPNGGQQILDVLVAHVGHQHHQSAARMQQRQLGGRCQIVGGHRLGLQVVTCPQQRIDRAQAAFGRHPAAVAATGEQTNAVALAQRQVGHHQRGIEHVVEVRQPAFVGHHAAAGVDHHHQLLVLFVLVLARDQLARACGGFPVDLAQAVADAVFAHLMEIRAFATAALEMCAD
ncbi:hypothetical protein D3C81_1652590 [compost metagenome]